MSWSRVESAQPFGDGVEHRIAGGMAMLVVDRLEAVEVEHQYRYRRLASLFRQQAFEELEQLVAVRQAGQGIVQGQMLDLRMGFDFVGDVGRRAAIAAATPLRIALALSLPTRAWPWLSRKAQTRLDGAPASGSPSSHLTMFTVSLSSNSSSRRPIQASGW